MQTAQAEGQGDRMSAVATTDSPVSMDVAFFVDKNALPGLHVALYSCLTHWKPDTALNVHVFHDQLSAEDLACLEETLKLTGKPFRFLPIVFSPNTLKGLKAFHSNWMAYGRLLLPELLPDVSRVVYLDCDLIVNVSLDLFPALCPDFNNCALAGIPQEPFEESIDRNLWKKLGLDPQALYFNSGVLYLNLDFWREKNLKQECLQFASDHAVHDQTALNYVFYKSFFALPGNLNFLLYPASERLGEPEDKILHFVGSPKPFDIAGSLLNSNSRFFDELLPKTAYQQLDSKMFCRTKLRRCFVLRRSYIHAIMLHAKRCVGGQTSRCPRL